jgi:hypothetical protein
MSLRTRLDRLESQWFARWKRSLEQLSDEELDALIDLHTPPGTKPAREWTPEELQREIDRARKGLVG